MLPEYDDENLQDAQFWHEVETSLILVSSSTERSGNLRQPLLRSVAKCGWHAEQNHV